MGQGFANRGVRVEQQRRVDHQSALAAEPVGLPVRVVHHDHGDDAAPALPAALRRGTRRQGPGRRSCSGRASLMAPPSSTAGLVAPLWGQLADLYGRKLMLVRAGLGMAVSMSLIGLATGRLAPGAAAAAGGVARRICLGCRWCWWRPKRRRTARAGRWGCCRPGTMAGTLLGPLLGGVMPGLIGIRNTFFLRRRHHLRRVPGHAASHQGRQAAGQGAGDGQGRLGVDRRCAAGDRHAADRAAAAGRQHVGRADHHRLCGQLVARSGPGHARIRAGDVGGCAGQHPVRAAARAAGRPGRALERGGGRAADRPACC